MSVHPRQDAPLTAKTVIIAGSTSYVTERFASALQNADHRAISVGTVDAFLDQLRANLDRVDLLILDLRLTHTGGPDLVRAIRAVEEGRVPILVLSGSVASADEVRELTTLGIGGYVNEHCAIQQIVPALAPHLFPDNFNRRSSPRVALAIPVSLGSGGTVTAALTLSLSKGGLAIRTMSPLDLFTQARVRFRLPSSRRDIEADSRVTWTDRRVGMGLQFERVDSVSQGAIDDFVDQHASAMSIRASDPE